MGDASLSLRTSTWWLIGVRRNGSEAAAETAKYRADPAATEMLPGRAAAQEPSRDTTEGIPRRGRGLNYAFYL